MTATPDTLPYAEPSTVPAAAAWAALGLLGDAGFLASRAAALWAGDGSDRHAPGLRRRLVGHRSEPGRHLVRRPFDLRFQYRRRARGLAAVAGLVRLRGPGLLRDYLALRLVGWKSFLGWLGLTVVALLLYHLFAWGR